jgi:hypothetical protein
MNIIQRGLGFNRDITGWSTAYLFVIAVLGLYSLAISALGNVAFGYGYRPEAHNVMLFIRYFQPVLVFPFFLISLFRRKWATIPLWVLALSICSLPFLISDAKLRALLGYWNKPFGLHALKEIAMVMVIPVAAQMAVWLRSRHNALQSRHELTTL